MSNLKKVLALSLVLALALSVAVGAFSYTEYVDGDTIELVNGNYRLAAELLHDIGVVVGKVDPNTQGATQKYMYDPQGEFDRASLARVLYLLDTGFTENSIENTGEAFSGIVVPFKDIKESWAANYIKYCYSKGLLSGRSSAVFDPTALVTAQELATALLALRGYTKADLAKNYPNNVVLYGYTNDCNLFATGLADSVPPDEGTTGKYLPGTTNAAGIRNYNKFGEFALTQALTREQAFYMIYNNLVNGSIVKKLSATVSTEGSESNIVFDTYLDLGENYLEYKYNMFYYAGTETGIISGSSNYGLGSTKSSGAKTFKVKVDGEEGEEEEFQDYGYTAVVKQKNSTMATGYTLNPTDWNANIGRKIIMKVVCWGDSDKIHSGNKAWGYTFVWDTGNNDPGITGSDVVITKEKKVEVKDTDTIKINGTEYDLYLGTGGFYVSTNNAVTTTLLSASDGVTALKMGNNKSADQLVFKLVDGKVYGVFAINTTYAKVSEVTSDGKIKTEGNVFGTDATATNIAGLAKDDYILAYKDAVDGVIKGAKATKSGPVSIIKETTGSTDKYYISGSTTPLVVGDSDGVASCNLSTLDTAKKYYFYTVGAYVYRFAEYDETDILTDMLLTGVTTYKTGGKTAFTFTGYVGGNPDTAVSYTTPYVTDGSGDYIDYNGLAAGSMVTVTTKADGTFKDIVASTAYVIGNSKQNAAADVNAAGEFYYDAANKLLYIFDGTNARLVSINADTKLYMLKSNYSKSSLTLADAVKVIVKVKDTNINTSATMVIGITAESI